MTAARPPDAEPADGLRVPVTYAVHRSHQCTAYVTAAPPPPARRSLAPEIPRLGAQDELRALPLDRQTRRLGFSRLVEQRLAAADTTSEAFRAIRAYAEGVNAWLAAMSRADVPLEYRLLGRGPTPWRETTDAIHCPGSSCGTSHCVSSLPNSVGTRSCSSGGSTQ